MTFQVHLNIPKPERGGSRTRVSMYPFGTMPVGGMFFVPSGDAAPLKVERRMHSAVVAFRKRDTQGRKFVVRRATHEGAAGVGVWRDL